MINKIYTYIISFLSGALIISILVLNWALNNLKPIINTNSYVESLEQSIKKLKQSGTNNSQDVRGDIDVQGIGAETPPPDEKPKRKKFLGIFNRRNPRQ